MSKRILQKNDLKAIIDKGYFQGYSDPQIHQEMVDDIVRMNKFEEAIKIVSKDKTIIDVGSVTGVLSMFAAKAGAQKLYAIECSDISKVCQQAIKDNNLEDKIVLINQLAEEAQLPEKSVDIIISEWMGYFLLYENMLPSVLNVRDKYLKEDGIIIPNRARIYIAAFQKENNHNGLNLSSIKRNLSSQARVDFINQETILSDYQQIFDFDLQECQTMDTDFSSDFELTIQKNGSLDGFVCWYSVNLMDDILLSTSFYDEKTHWKQTLFIMDKDTFVKQDEKVWGTITSQKQEKKYRALQFKLSYKTKQMKLKKTNQFHLD